jgi:plasmid maintenance system antidote protein VapI
VAKENWKQDIAIMKMLMILLVNKMGVKQNAIAKALDITEGRLSQILNPKKYKK